MGLEQLVLLRHGQTEWNIGLRLQGHADIPLNQVGRAQALAAAPSVAAMKADVIVSSDLTRAFDTATAVAAISGLEVRTDQRLRETSMGEWEGLNRDQVISGWPQEWASWRTTSADASPPGGESRRQVAVRANEVVQELEQGAYQRALLVAHGGLIVGLTGLLLNLSDESWASLMGVNNCHWVVLRKYSAGWRLHSYNAGLTDVVIPGSEEEVPGA